MINSEAASNLSLVVLGIVALWNFALTFNKIFDESPKFIKNLSKLSNFIIECVSKKSANSIGLNHVSILFVAAILTNLAGFSLSSWIPGILYLDMVGTAALAFYMGPIWGMICGVITNLITFSLDSGEYQPYLLAYGHTNVVGGFFLGIASKIIQIS